MLGGVAACGRLGFDPSGDGGLPGSEGASTHGFRRHVLVHTDPGSPVATGYAIRVPLVDVAAHARPDFSDVRVLKGAAGPEYARVVDPTAPEGSALWLALPAAIAGGATDDFYLYYGDPSMSGLAADPSQVFAFYDGFMPTLSSQWLVQGSVTAGGALQLRPGDNGVTTSAPPPGVTALSELEFRASISNPAGPGNCYFLGYQRAGDFVQSGPWINWVGSLCPGTGGDSIVRAWVNSTVNATGPNVTQDTAPHWFRIDRGPTMTSFYRDGTKVFATAVSDNAVYSIELRNLSTANTVTIDFVRARPLVSTEPSVMLGSEEAL